ncbi:MAG: hypothetical protein KKH44_04840 [Bacteroidetes bacterium]|nr:hypothetical protein [Bacteroidota bacterium]
MDAIINSLGNVGGSIAAIIVLAYLLVQSTRTAIGFQKTIDNNTKVIESNTAATERNSAIAHQLKEITNQLKDIIATQKSNPNP